jgi:hypothetical protein
MRLWDCDPRHLSNRHLLGEHRELHSLYSGGWEHHPEYVRFQERRGLLALRHACQVQAMSERFGTVDSTPIRLPLEYERVFDRWAGHVISWEQLMVQTLYPPTRLEHGLPWVRDDVPREWYQEHLQDWSWDLVHEFHSDRPIPSNGRFYGSAPRVRAA